MLQTFRVEKGFKWKIWSHLKLFLKVQNLQFTNFELKSEIKEFSKSKNLWVRCIKKSQKNVKKRAKLERRKGKI